MSLLRAAPENYRHAPARARPPEADLHPEDRSGCQSRSHLAPECKRFLAPLAVEGRECSGFQQRLAGPTRCWRRSVSEDDRVRARGRGRNAWRDRESSHRTDSGNDIPYRSTRRRTEELGCRPPGQRLIPTQRHRNRLNGQPRNKNSQAPLTLPQPSGSTLAWWLCCGGCC